jgi:hypothetical protein
MDSGACGQLDAGLAESLYVGSQRIAPPLEQQHDQDHERQEVRAMQV